MRLSFLSTIAVVVALLFACDDVTNNYYYGQEEGTDQPVPPPPDVVKDPPAGGMSDPGEPGETPVDPGQPGEDVQPDPQQPEPEYEMGPLPDSCDGVQAPTGGLCTGMEEWWRSQDCPVCFQPANDGVGCYWEYIDGQPCADLDEYYYYGPTCLGRQCTLTMPGYFERGGPGTGACEGVRYNHECEITAEEAVCYIGGRCNLNFECIPIGPSWCDAAGEPSRTCKSTADCAIPRHLAPPCRVAECAPEQFGEPYGGRCMYIQESRGSACRTFYQEEGGYTDGFCNAVGACCSNDDPDDCITAEDFRLTIPENIRPAPYDWGEPAHFDYQVP